MLKRCRHANQHRDTGAKTKREAVELGLAALIRLEEQRKIRDYRGRLTWQGDLEKLRRDIERPMPS